MLQNTFLAHENLFLYFKIPCKSNDKLRLQRCAVSKPIMETSTDKLGNTQAPKLNLSLVKMGHIWFWKYLRVPSFMKLPQLHVTDVI